MKTHNEYFFEDQKMRKAVKEIAEPTVRRVTEVQEKLAMYYLTYFKIQE